jgi:hypothetical protein
MLLLILRAIDLKQRARIAEEHRGERLDRVSFPATRGSEKKYGSHGLPRLAGLRLNSLEQAQNGVGGLRLSDDIGRPTLGYMFEP